MEGGKWREGFASGVTFCFLMTSSLSRMPSVFSWKLFKEVLKMYQCFPHPKRRNLASILGRVPVDPK